MADFLRPLLAFSIAFVSTASLSDDATHFFKTFSVSATFFGVVMIFAPLFAPTFRTLFANRGVTYALRLSRKRLPAPSVRPHLDQTRGVVKLPIGEQSSV